MTADVILLISGNISVGNLSQKLICYCLHRSQFQSSSSGVQWVKQVHTASFTLGYKANDLLLGLFGKISI